MARPRKKDSELLNKHLPAVRCSETDLKMISANARNAGLSISEYIRKMATSGKVNVYQTKSGFDKQLVNQLKKIGTNLNQQTKKINIFGNLDSDHKRIWFKLESLLDQIIGAS